MSERIRESEVLKRLGIGKTKLWKLRCEGKFPDPVKNGRFNEYYLESVERAERLFKDVAEAAFVKKEKATRRRLERGVA